MEATLIAVTLLSLAMAVAMSAVVWRLLREERRRSAARVARLAALAAGDEGPEIPRAPRARVQADVDLPLRLAPDPPRRQVVAAPESARPVEQDAVPDALFAHAEPTDGGHRAMIFGAAIVLVLLTLAALVTLGGRRPTADRQAASIAPAPLELLSLRHSKDGDILMVSGLVRNPSEGHDLRRVEVVAFVFDQSGEFIGSGRAPLDFTLLAPGAESPFNIRIDHAGGVGRYRIGFRSEDGGVLGHVDRRSTRVAAPEPVSSSAEAGLATTSSLPR